MYEELLSACGLTRNETAVYLALMRIGKSKSGKIIEESGISSGKIYETLHKLCEKGLIKEVIENGVKNFIANDPKTLILYLNEKESALHEKKKELQKVLPSLSKMCLNKENSEAVSLIKNLKGISSVIYPCLEVAKEIRIMGVRSSKDDRYNNFWRSWHKKRIESKKEAKIIFSDKNTEYYEFFKHLPFTKIKTLIHFSPSAIMIIDDHAFMFSYKKELTCIHIFSEEIAGSLRIFFDDLWKAS